MRFIKILNKRFLGKITIVAVAFLTFTCVYINGVDYNPSVVAGEAAEFTVHVNFDAQAPVTDSRMVIGFLAPKSWNAALNTTVTYTSNIDAGTETMSLVPPGSSPKEHPGQTWAAAIRSRFGVGDNVLDDMEWVVYWTNKTYTVNNGDDIFADVLISAKAGPENLKFRPTFFLNHTDNGFSDDVDHFKIFKGDCFAVTGGEGDLIDFCNLRFNTVQPLTVTKNDLVTINFQGDVNDNDLINEDEIFLCATAETDLGTMLDVCVADESSKMKKQFTFGNSYTITIWPARYFSVPEGEEIAKLHYSFRNADGSVEIKEDTEPFVFTFKCP